MCENPANFDEGTKKMRKIANEQLSSVGAFKVSKEEEKETRPFYFISIYRSSILIDLGEILSRYVWK